MTYEIYANAGKSLGKVLYQLSTIGVPLDTVKKVYIDNQGELKYEDSVFATFKWNERNVPIFIFIDNHEHFNQLPQPKCIVLMGSIDNGETYVDAGAFTDTNCLLFTEKVYLFSKTYLADIKGNPLREQVLVTSTLSDKISRLKNKFHKN